MHQNRNKDSWKKFLLKSGLPFEYEIKEAFVKNGCTVWDEFSYLKKDENEVEKEFSYDLDANFWEGQYSVDFMVECKYKTEPTKWFFTPNPYFYQDDLTKNSFFHPVDVFSQSGFLFDKHPFEDIVDTPLGPFCLKGVEVYKNQFLESNITRAISQLSYAFTEKIVDSMNSQLNSEFMSHAIFLHIPIIITNADLFLIKENLTVKEIENASSIDKVATQHDFLVFHHKVGEQLKNHNLSKLQGFLASQDAKKVKAKFSTFTEDIGHFVDTMASYYCPQSILIMHHDSDHANYKKLFDYIKFFLIDSELRTKKMNEVAKKTAIKQKRFEEKMKNIKKSKDQVD